MPHHPCTAARSASYTALILILSVLLSLLLPTGAARAASAATTAAATTADTCAALPLAPFGDPGSAVGRPTIPAGESACFTFTADAPGLHRVLLNDQHNGTYAQVLDGESQLSCYDTEWGLQGWCRLPRAGVFTLKVVNRGWESEDATVAVFPLAATAGCEPEIGTSWDGARVSGSASGPVAIDCHPFTGKAGERITVAIATARYGDAESWITDGTGARICPRFKEDDNDGCVLPGTGPFRVLTRVSWIEGGFPGAYTLTVRRLSDPVGCASVPVNGYGSAPTTVDPATGCKTFTIPAAGHYDVYEVQSGSRSPLAVYDRAGTTVCRTWASCALPAAGDYTVFTDHATLILDRAATTGCEPVQLGTYQGSFAAAGEIDCLTLPLPAGARMAALTALSGSAPRPAVTVVDAEGAGQCDGGDLSSGTCALTGKAPFRALVSTEDQNPATGSYRIALHRTDGAGNCPSIPAGDFTSATASARFSTGGGVFSHCLSIPADAHSAVENLQLQTVAGTSAASISVLDPGGEQVCRIVASLSTWTTCDLAPGVTHTVLVTGRDTPATYTLTRRDVTATAKGCTANPATPVGGPSTGGTPGAPGTLLCRQVTTGSAKDVLHLAVRDPLDTAYTLVYGADGNVPCGYRSGPCAATGSTRYQVLITVPANQKASATYRFDALRIGTAAGPAPECVKVPNVSYGYGPITGTLNEQHTAVCAALPTAYNDRFDMVISGTAGGGETTVPALYGSSLANGCMLSIPTGYQCAIREPRTTEVTPSILVLSLPEGASESSFSAELVCWSVRCGTEAVTVTSVSPTGGTTGGKATVKVTGTALHQDDRVEIGGFGRTVESTTTSVSADRKTLTAVLDLTGVPVGNWYLSVVTHNAWEYRFGSFTVTAAALENTAAPQITGTAKVGAKVTASTGSWTPPATSYSYQWKADGKAVKDATAAGYTIPAALLGKKLTVTVTAHRADSPNAAATSAAVTVAKGAAPKAGTAPRISGTAKVGAKVTAVSGSWTPAATSYSYQWKADGKAVKGATAAGYTIPAALLGKKLTVTVTAHRTGHADGTATTGAVKVAKGSAPKAVKQPAISGTAKVGRTLKAAHGSWTPSPSSYTYQWYANGKAITGATKSSLVLKAAQRGKRITVKVTARRTGHANGAATSKATSVVAR
ncbi:hypothetical protein [Peterkaempfera bronchialis]|uniref:hypothetical protein n=1 Tax=Peterkaempfera bronchialis TaxID=2126346 RepID=UPI003C309923